MGSQVIQKGMTDQWDYCLRRLFVLKSTPLKDAMKYVFSQLAEISSTDYRSFSSLAPGAKNLLSVITDISLPRDQRINTSKRIRDLNVADWALLLRAFEQWPFKPDVSTSHYHVVWKLTSL